MDLNDYVTTDDKEMILVEYLLPGYNNQKSYIGVEQAIRGAALGKWTLIKKPSKGKKYEAQVMVAEPPVALSYEDVHGKQTYETKAEAKALKKKRIAWVEDSWILGGAELSGRTVTRIGEDCGFSIERVTGQTDPILMDKVFSECDLIVLNNVWGFSADRMARIMAAIESKPYVKYEHDHREIEHRRPISERLFKDSILNIFISPAHFENHKKAFGIEGACLPLAIDTEVFHPVDGVERVAGTALVSNLRNFKTWINLQNFVDAHLEMEFTVLSDELPKLAGMNVRQKAKVPHEEMPKVYSEFEYLVHIMDGWGAGERVIFEAALCNCKVIANERVGHLSWGRDLTDTEGLRTWLRQAPYRFWREVELRM